MDSTHQVPLLPGSFFFLSLKNVLVDLPHKSPYLKLHEADSRVDFEKSTFRPPQKKKKKNQRRVGLDFILFSVGSFDFL